MRGVERGEISVRFRRPMIGNNNNNNIEGEGGQGRRWRWRWGAVSTVSEGKILRNVCKFLGS